MKKTKSVLLIIGSFVLAIFLAAVGVRDLIHSRQLIARGKSTMGRVVDGEDQVSGRLRTHTYYLTVNFKPEEGVPVTKKVAVSHTVYDHTEIGGPVKVWYLAEDPTICAAGDKVETRYGSILLSLVFVGAGIFLVVTFNKGSDDDGAKLGERLGLLTVPGFEYAAANPDDFKQLDMEFYNQGRLWLESLGYVFLGDDENLTVSKASGRRTLLRRMASADRTILATLYHFKAPLGKESKVLDLETWETSGGFVCTSNAAAAGKFASPPQIDASYLPSDTPLDAVLHGHIARLNAFYAQHPGVSAYGISGIEDARRLANEMQRIKSEFRSGANVAA